MDLHNSELWRSIIPELLLALFMDLHDWIMDLHNWIMDIHNSIMDIHNSIMDIHNWIMEIHNWIMEIHNYGVLSPLVLHIIIATMMITTTMMMTTTMTIIMIMVMMTTTMMMMTTTTTWCMMIIVKLRFWFSFLFWFKSITTETIVKSNHNTDKQNRPFVNILKNPKIFWQAINVMKHCDDSNCFIAK